MEGWDEYALLPPSGLFGYTGDFTLQGLSSGYAGGALLQELGVLDHTTRTGIGLAWTISWPSGLLRALDTTVDNIVTGFAYRVNGPIFAPIMTFVVNNFLGSQWLTAGLYYNGNGAVTFGIYNKYGQLTNSWHSTPNVVFGGIWQYIEIKYVQDATNGTVLVKVDGIVVLNITGVPTIDPAMQPGINMVGVNGPQNTSMSYDDWYVLTNDGNGLCDFLGDVVIRALTPNTDAGPNTMTQFGGSLGHYTTLNDPASADNASYVYSTTIGDAEQFTLSALPIDIIDVLAVEIGVRAQKTSAGASCYQIYGSYGGSITASPVHATHTSWNTERYRMETCPDGSAWTLTSAQNLQAGFEIVATP
jgi:hypothetical protein